MKKLILILAFCVVHSLAFGGTFWIRQGGTAANEGAATGPCNTASACGDDSNINSWASTGDTVNICSDGGDLTTAITGSGACNNGACDSGDLITYQKAADSAGTPAWNGNTLMIDVSGTVSNYKEYLTFKNLKHIEYNTNGYPIDMEYVKNITFDGITIDIDPTADTWDGWIDIEYCEDVILQNSTFDSVGMTADSEAEGVGFWYDAKGILIYNNTFGTISHNALKLATVSSGDNVEEIVIRGNVFANRWEHHLSVSHKIFVEADNGRVLIEQNTFRYGGIDDDDSSCVTDCEANQENYPHIGGNQIITRDNIFHDNDVDIGWIPANSSAATLNDWKHYHNTHYNSDIPDTNSEGGHPIFLYDADDTLTGLAIINNVMWLYDAVQNGRDVQIYHQTLTLSGDRVENNILGETGPNSSHRYSTQDEKTTAQINAALSSWSNNEDGDPLFADAGSADFSLSSSSSPAYDKGTYLTEVNDAGGGSGTSMVVDDATFFYGADWGVPGGGESGDYIKVDNPTSADFVVQITGANYATDTLTLASSQTWEDNADVYWCPLRNATCFYDSAPDAGAEERLNAAAIQGILVD